MDFVISSDIVIRFAFWSGFCALTTTALLIVWIAILRITYWRNEQRKREFLSVWQDLLTESALGNLQPRLLPAISQNEIVFFLTYWNQLQDSLRGEARERLNHLVRITGMDYAVRRMLQNGNSAEKLLAIISLGRMGEKADVAALKKMLASDQPIVCLHAAHALLRIDPDTLGELMPLIVQRSDLPTDSIANMLKEMGPDTVSPVLADMLRPAFLFGATHQQIVRLIALSVTAHSSVTHAALREIVDGTEDTEVLAACLKVMRHPDALVKVRKFASHPSWQVRVHAASALGDIGEEKDLILLINLLADPQWWVRYRAAQSISRLPFVTIGHLENLKKHLGDNFAVDMINQVISERAA